MSAPPEVSVIVPVHDGAATLGAQLDALAQQSFAGSWELLVCDNRSTDGTRELVASWSGRLPQLRLVDADARAGAAYARNVGAQAAGGEVLAFCDADDEVAPGWLAALVDAATGADVVAGCIDTTRLNDELARCWRPFLPYGGVPVSHGFLPYGLSANLAIRADVFGRLGGFREDYPTGEDVELAWRAQLQSLRFVFAPDAVVHYRFRTGLTALVQQYLAYGAIGPRLYRDFREDGMPGSPARAAVGPWLRLLAAAPFALLSRTRRGDVLRRLAYRAGRVRGSLRTRVVYL